MIAAGELDESLIHRLRRLDGLPGHPDVSTDGIKTNTGSLGMGISKGKGFVRANRLRGQDHNVFVVTGDGELQEGQIWESLISAANDCMGELTVVVDHNKIQSDYSLDRTSSLGDIVAKFASYGWHVERLDGHDVDLMIDTLERLNKIRDVPKVIIADTVKGKGISFIEGNAIDSDVELFRFHSGAPNADDYVAAITELTDRIEAAFKNLNLSLPQLEVIDRPSAKKLNPNLEKLIPAYTDALLKLAERRSEVVALDADLCLDMGLIPFIEKFPDRFFECGIAEQDMVSQAGGLALSGFLPIVHSFSCFLTTRANEQIYNNATEGTKILYIGGLSGVLPAGPGHSHQSVREISAIGGIPGLVMAAPSCAAEVAPLLNWMADEHDGASFLRLVSLPFDAQYQLPADYKPTLGRGVALTGGDDVVLVGSGPTVLSEAVAASKLLAEENIGVKVYNLPWLNKIDESWLETIVDGVDALFVLDDHYVAGGQGEKVLAGLAKTGVMPKICRQIGLEKTPPCGQPDEVLARVGLAAGTLAEKIRISLR